MAEYDTVLIRYGELTTKGKNRKDFIRKLDQNISKNIRIVAVVLMDFTDPLRELGKTGKTSGLYVETDQNVFRGLSQDCEIMQSICFVLYGRTER